MANVIRIKRRSTTADAPTTSQAVNGELAFNENNDILYYGKGGNSTASNSVIKIGGSGAFLTTDTTQGSVGTPLTGTKWFSTTSLKITGGSSNQVLSTDGSGNISWASVSANAYSNVSDGTTTAAASGADTLRFRATSPLTVAVGSNDVTFGDNVLYGLGTVTTANGGTGLTSYTAGDLPYYSAGTALTKLAIGSAGNYLKVVSGAPSWANFDTDVNARSITSFTIAPITDLSLNNNKITNLATPTSNNDAANKSYVDSVAQGLHVHATVDAATTARLGSLAGVAVSYSAGTQAITWTGGTAATAAGFTDGVTLTASTTESSASRILVKNEGDASGLGAAYNGTYYVYGARELRRTTDGNAAADYVGGDFVYVIAGTLFEATGWVQTEKVVTLDTTPIIWQQFSGAGTITAGDGLTATGTTINVATANSGRIVVNPDNIDLASVITTSISTTTPAISFVTGISTDGYGRVTSWNFETVRSGSTSQTGILQLTDSTSSTSTSTAATPNSVKTAWDLANAALPKAGGTMTGKIVGLAPTTSLATFQFSSGVDPTLPVSGDLWNNSGTLKFYNGSATKNIAFTDSTLTGTWNGGIIATNYGGTGLSSFTNNGAVYATSTSTLTTGTLPVASGGTGITSFGSGVATWLGSPTSANLAAAVTDETGTGSLVFATNPSLTTPRYSISSAVNATGLTQGTAASLPSDINIVTVAASGSATGVILPTAVAGMRVIVRNATATSIQVYPATGAAIDNASTNASIGISTLKSVEFIATSSTTWHSFRRITDGEILRDNEFTVGSSNFDFKNTVLTAKRSYTFQNSDGTVAFLENKLSDFAQSSSSEVFSKISDKTGTGGAMVFATGPTLSQPVIDNIKIGFTSTATSAATLTLTNTSSFRQFFTGTTTHTLVLPVATTLANGQSYEIHNNSTGAITVQTSGLNTLVTVNAGQTVLVTCINTAGGTGTASWDFDITGASASTGSGSLVYSTSPTLVTPALGTPASGVLSNCTSIPVAQATGVLPVANGGTGQTTLQAAINALAGATTAAQFLRGNGSNVVMSAIQAGDVPTLNQNTTGSAATLTTGRDIQTNLASTSAASFNGSANITPGVTGILGVANGGTGISSFGAGVATWLNSPTSANLRTAVTDETGTGGALVFATGPTITLPQINNVLLGYTSTATAATTLTLTVDSNYRQFFTGTTTHTVVLPVATTLTTGHSFKIHNNSTGAVTVQTSGLNTLVTVNSNQSVLVTCVNPSGGTGTASWSTEVMGGSTSTGTGNVVYATSPTLVTPILGTPQSGNLSNCTNIPVAQATGVLPTANGGTGLSSFTSGGAVYATSTSALTTGTLPVTAGGTGVATLTSKGVLYGNGTSAVQATAAATWDATNLVGQFLKADSSNNPVWSDVVDGGGY